MLTQYRTVIQASEDLGPHHSTPSSHMDPIIPKAVSSISLPLSCPSLSPPPKKKLLPHGLEGGHAPWEPDGVYLQLVFRFGDTKKEFGPGLGLEGQKTKIPLESTGHSLYMCVCTDVSAHVHPFLPPLALVHIPGKIDCLPRIICPRHPTADPPVSLHLALWTPPPRSRKPPHPVWAPVTPSAPHSSHFSLTPTPSLPSPTFIWEDEEVGNTLCRFQNVT